MDEGVLIPVVCQSEHCNRMNWMHFENRGWYAFYFRSSDYDKHRIRISRSKENIEKSNHKVICELCGEETFVFTMKKPSALKFIEICKRHNDELAMVTPGQMRLPGEEETPISIPGSALYSKPDFLNIEREYRLEEVYSKLIDEINTCYEYEAYSSALVMLRKLIENLLIDILRFKYESLGLYEFYYDDDKNQFLPLNILIANFESILPDYSRMGITSSHIRVIKGLQKTGNRSAHSIIDLVEERKINSLKNNANQAVIVLIRIIGIVKGMLDQDGKLVKKRRK